MSQTTIFNLPIEILIKIFSYVDEDSVFALPFVCRPWRDICKTITIQKINWRNCMYVDSFSMDIGAFVNLLCSFRFISIGLSRCWELTDDEITKIGEGCPQLQSLNLFRCKQVTDVGITKIGEGCPQLQSLDLSGCKQVTDVGITKIVEGCPQLQSLDLSGCSEVTDLVYRTSERNVHNCNRSV